MANTPTPQNPVAGFDTSGGEHWVQVDSSGDLHVVVDNFVAPASPVTVIQPTGSLLHAVTDSGSTTAVTQPTGSNLHTVVDSGTVTVQQSTGSNLHVAVDSAPTTTVQQSTGSNLHVVSDTGSTTTVTQPTGTNLHTVVDSGSITATQATGSNLHVVSDTGSTTTVTQPTGTNLHTVVDSGSITATQATGTNLHTVVDNLTQDSAKNALINFGGASADAFGRARVASPTSVFQCQFQYDSQPLLFSRALTGTGTIAKTANESSLTLSTGGTASGAQAINQTKAYFRYQPGKSQQVILTGFLGVQKSNVRSRLGYFDANDGIYFEMDGTAGASVNQRSSTSGSPVTTSVAQASWNIDKMDGTGPSGVTINFANTQIFLIDMQWLGVGRVRLGFIVNGLVCYCHQFQNANSIVSPYMNTANLPVRSEITNTGVAASTTTMKQVCMSVNSEGGVQYPQAYQFSASNGTTSITAASGTRTPMISIQPALTFGGITNRVYVPIEQLEVFVSGANPVYWELVYNGTLTGASFGATNSNSATNFDISSTVCTGGIIVDAGYAGGGAGSSKSGINATLSALFPFALDLNGANPDTFTLCAAGVGGTAATNCQIGWSEIR